VQLKGLKRFYKAVTAEPAGAEYVVCLDGRPVKTPGRAVMALPTPALAEAVAGEWTVQGKQIDLATMPLTILAWAAIDRVGPNRQQAIEDAAVFSGHDLVCYRAEGPEDLVARQRAAWQPLLDWAARDLDAPLATTAGIVSVAQPEAAQAALRRAIEAKNDFELVALGVAVKGTGSLVIGLALCAGRIDVATAHAAAHIDEAYQMERWGEDVDTACRHASVRGDLEAVARLIDLLRT
jgi:chaperone required for assembly of F1-ATPase